jgi:neurotransmitter:Na+ symporter, NSS family
MPLSAIADAARHPRPVWRSERAYVLATVAGVVGLGNIWRFPYMAGLHGGGSFLLAYAVCVLVIAIPLAVIESAAGSLGRRSPVGAFRRAAGKWGAVLGWATVAMTVAIMSYYVVVTGWTLGYATDALRGQMSTFDQFTQGYRSLWLLLVVSVLVFILLVRGVGAIERASLYLVPVLVLIVAGLAVYGQTLSGAAEARAFYFGLDPEYLFDPVTWRAAGGQAFYSIGIGQGILIAYGSFVPSNANLLRSISVIAVTNALVSVVAGLMVFSVVFTFGIAPTAGSELSFTAFPIVFEAIAGGSVIGMIFFVLLFLAGFTSCIGGAVVTMSTVRDELGVGTVAAASGTVGLIALLGVPSALSFTDAAWSIGGKPVLDQVDQITGAGAIVVLGLVGGALLARAIPQRVLTASMHADPLQLGPMTLRPSSVVSWVGVLPVVAGILYLAVTIV